MPPNQRPKRSDRFYRILKEDSDEEEEEDDDYDSDSSLSSVSSSPPTVRKEKQTAKKGKHTIQQTLANKIYNMAEVRRIILSMMDNGSLANMMRVEKGLTADAARALYETVDSDLVLKMGRTSVSRDPFDMSFFVIYLLLNRPCTDLEI